MTVINAKIDDVLVGKFRHVVYTKYGLKKGDFKRALEEAMLDYVRKYSPNNSELNRLAQTAQTIFRDEVPEISSEH
jgi:hypothetical protein